MDWAFKAVLTATVVSAVMMAARLFGRQLAGLLAGLPVISAPALLWLAHDQGAAFAQASAVGSLAACVAAPLFATVFERLTRRHGLALALAGSALSFVSVLLLLQPLHDWPVSTLLLVVAASLAVQHLVQRQAPQPGWVKPRRGEPWFSAAVAGLIVALVTLGAQRLGPFWSGAASTLPIISACALVHLHRAGSHGDVAAFVGGYASGNLIRALVLFVFWLLVAWAGAAGALLAGLGVGVLAARGLRWHSASQKATRPVRASALTPAAR